MRDMFYNYDYNTNRKLHSHKESAFFDPEVILTGDPNIMIIRDAKGRELGVRVKQGMPFTLYFYLDDYSTAERVSDNQELYDLVLKCKVQLDVLSSKHNVIFTIENNAADIFNTETSSLIIDINQELACKLNKETYRIRVRLVEEDGTFYEVYSENDGLLIVR